MDEYGVHGHPIMTQQFRRVAMPPMLRRASTPRSGVSRLIGGVDWDNEPIGGIPFLIDPIG